MHSGLINLSGRVALVTGGSNETGAAVCRVIAEAGSSVVIQYYNGKDKAGKTCEYIGSKGGVAANCFVDLSDRSSIDELFSFIKDKFGRLDILVNNAHFPITRSLVKESEWEGHQEQIDVMMKGTFYCCKRAALFMEESGGGSIINIISTLVDHPVKGYSSFITAASALTGFTKNLAVEAGEKDIRVNMIAPGFVLTGHAPYAPQHVQDAISNATPLGRLATPDDIAGGVLFFSSDLSRFITGQTLVIDGGYSLSGMPA
ncbi:MAG: SDR family oxidoreductase [Nitrospirae bacterium]|nr:SDR family oxidoreductase [Nitrospirota bacterium]